MLKIKSAIMNNKLISVLVLIALIAAVALLLQFALTANNTAKTSPAAYVSKNGPGYDLAARSTEGLDTSEVTASVSGQLARVEFDELPAQSSLVVRGVASADYDEFLIQAAESTGDPVCFTDRYFEVLEVYRGEQPNNTIAIRILGGNKGAGDVTVWIAESEPSLIAGHEYILYLHKPNYGGGWETEGDYYEVVGAIQGAFSLEGDGLFHSIAQSQTLDPETFAQEMAAINQNLPVDLDYNRNYFLNALASNRDNGMITEEQYLNEIRLFDVYGTIVG